MIYTSLHLYLQQKKSSEIVVNTVANIIAVLLTYQLPTMLVQFMAQFPIILLNDLSFPSDDVIVPRPLRPSTLCSMASTLV